MKRDDYFLFILQWLVHRDDTSQIQVPDDIEDAVLRYCCVVPGSRSVSSRVQEPGRGRGVAGGPGHLDPPLLTHPRHCHARQLHRHLDHPR